MPSTMRFLLPVVLLGTVNFVSAQSSSLRACDDVWISVTNQSDIDFYSSCPSLDDPMFYIDHNFSGPFEMPGVKSLGKFSAGYYGPKLAGSDNVDDRVTSISMPDLQNTTWVANYGGIFASYLPNLTSISFPKVENVGDLVIMGNPLLKKFTFESLSNVTGGVLIEGPIDEINFPALKTVNCLQIKSTGDLDCLALGKNLSSLTFPQPPLIGSCVGFTCWTYDEANRWNSSDPNQSKGSGESTEDDGSAGGASTTSASPSSPTSTPSSSGSGAQAAAPSNTAGSAASSTYQNYGMEVIFCVIGLITFYAL